MKAAGVLLRSPRGKYLFVRRSDTGRWATPSGHLEEGEKPWEAAKRETYEETGFSGPFSNPQFLLRTDREGKTFWLFQADVPFEFVPRLDHEHTAYKWTASRSAPEPLHWGLRWLKK